LNFILSVTAEIFAWGEWGELIIQGIRIWMLLSLWADGHIVLKAK
jgi:hypothetical protein